MWCCLLHWAAGECEGTLGKKIKGKKFSNFCHHVSQCFVEVLWAGTHYQELISRQNLVMSSHLADAQFLKIIALKVMMQDAGIFLFNHAIFIPRYTRIIRSTLTGSFAVV